MFVPATREVARIAWFLPKKDELTAMYAVCSLGSQAYWSSSVYSYSSITVLWVLNSVGGSTMGYASYLAAYVWPVREF